MTVKIDGQEESITLVVEKIESYSIIKVKDDGKIFHYTDIIMDSGKKHSICSGTKMDQALKNKEKIEDSIRKFYELKFSKR